MRKITLLAALLIFSASLHAGFVDVICSNTGDPTFAATHQWDFVFETQSVWLIESYTHTGTDSVFVDGETTEDPILSMTKAVTNENGHVWTSYSLTLGGTATFVSASSDLLPVVDLSDTYILFSGGTVNHGDTLNMAFTVNVPTTGMFSFCLTQLAIPEPASLSLLGLGALALIRRK
jgi:hypothetical protein